MPRPKPELPLIVRSVRMNDTQWAAFDELGGADWLRSRIDKLHMSGIARRQRDKRIRDLYQSGLSRENIAEHMDLSRQTVWRVTA